MESSAIKWNRSAPSGGLIKITGEFVANKKKYEISVLCSEESRANKSLEKVQEEIEKISTDKLAQLAGYTFRNDPENIKPFKVLKNEKAVETLSDEFQDSEQQIANIFKTFSHHISEEKSRDTPPPKISPQPSHTIRFEEIKPPPPPPIPKNSILENFIEDEKKNIKKEKVVDKKQNDIPEQKLNNTLEKAAQAIHKKLCKNFGKAVPTYALKTGIVSCTKEQFLKAQQELAPFFKKQKMVSKDQTLFRTQLLQLFLTGSCSTTPRSEPLFSLTNLKIMESQPFHIDTRTSPQPVMNFEKVLSYCGKENDSLADSIGKGLNSFQVDNLGRAQNVEFNGKQYSTGTFSKTFNLFRDIRDKFIENVKDQVIKKEEINRIIDSPMAKQLKDVAGGASEFDQQAFLKVLALNSQTANDKKYYLENRNEVVSRSIQQIEENLCLNKNITEHQQIVENKSILQSMLFMQIPLFASMIDESTLQELGNTLDLDPKFIQSALFLKTIEIMISLNQSFLSHTTNLVNRYGWGPNKAYFTDFSVCSIEKHLSINNNLNTFEWNVSQSIKDFDDNSLATFTTKSLVASSSRENQEAVIEPFSHPLVSPFVTKNALNVLETIP